MNNKYKRLVVKNQTLQAILDWCHGWRTVVVIIGLIGILLHIMKFYYSLN